MSHKPKKTKITPPKPVDLTAKRDEECVPVALSILKLIGDHASELLTLDMTKEKQTESQKKFFVESIEPLIRLADLRTVDLTYLFSLVLLPVENVKYTAEESLKDLEDAVFASKFNLKNGNDIRISHLIQAHDEYLTSKNTGVDNTTSAKPE